MFLSVAALFGSPTPRVLAVTGYTKTQTVPIDPKVAGLVKQAGSEAKAHQYDATIQYLSAALQMKPETKTASAIYSWRADTYFHKGEVSKAMADATESIRLNALYFGWLLVTRHHLPRKR